MVNAGSRLKVSLRRVLSFVRVPPLLVFICRLVLWAAAFVAAFQGQMLLEDRRHLGRALGYMVVATIFIAAATLRQRVNGPVEPEEGSAAPGLRRHLRAAPIWLALLVVALGLGIAFRVYELPSNPKGIWFDEAQNGIVANRMIHDSDYRPVFITGYVGTDRPALPVYVFAAGVKLIGRDILALRSVSALAGILTLAALFFLGRELFGPRVAALATFFLAVMRWHLNFSRLAMEPIWSPFFAVSAIFFLVRGVRRGRWYDFAISGLLLGLGLQFYWAFLLVPLLYAIYTAHSFLARQSARFISLVIGALLVAVVGFAVYSPVASWGIHHPAQYKARANTVTITKNKNLEETVRAVQRTTRLHVLMFNSAGDNNGRHNLPGAPMLDTFTGIFFVLGLGISLTRLWQPRHMLLLAWMVILLQPAIWSLEFEAPQALRAILVTPAVALLAALPLGALWAMAEGQPGVRPEHEASRGTGPTWRRRLVRLSSKLWRYLVSGAVALTLLFFLAQVAHLNFQTYFQKQLKRADVWASYSTAPTLVAKEIKRLGPDDHYLMSSTFVGQPTLEFVNPSIGSGIQFSLDLVRDVPIPSDQTTAIFLDPDYEAYIPWLRTLYPEAEVRMFTPPDISGPVVLYEMIISPEEVKAIQGVDAVYTPAAGALPLERREPALDLDWTAGGPVPLPFDAHWSGVINVPKSGQFLLTMEAPGQVRLLLDGQLLGEGLGSVQASKALFKGQHRLEVMAHIEAAGNVRLSANGTPLPASAYFVPPVAGHGLLGSFYSNASFSGNPVFEELDPFIGFRYHSELPFGGAVSIIWRGKVEAPSAGTYQFDVGGIGTAQVSIDGQLVAGMGTPNIQGAGAIELTQGLHDIEVRFSNGGGGARVYLRWTPPGGEREIVPSDHLYPP